MALSDKDRDILKGVFSDVPQIQAINMIKGSTAAQIAQTLMILYRKQLTTEDQAAIVSLVTLDRDGRIAAAGAIIGDVIEQAAPGIFSKLFGFLFGWMK